MDFRVLALLIPSIIIPMGIIGFTTDFQTFQSTSTKEMPGVMGHIEIVEKDSSGKIVAYRQTDNLVVSNGLNATINQLFQNSLQTTSSGTVNKFNYIGVGTGVTAVASTDTGLQTQRGNKVLGTVTAITASGGTGMGAQISSTWAANRLQNASGTTAITEAGLFDAFANATASSNMYSHQTFSAINVASADTLQVTWKITFSHS